MMFVMESDKKPQRGRPRTTTKSLPQDWKRLVREARPKGREAVKSALGIGIGAFESLVFDKEFRDVLFETDETD